MYPDFHPVILCTASRMVQTSNRSKGWYVQGAADDSESWAQGLTPTLFWRHKTELLKASPNEVEDLIREILHADATCNGQSVSRLGLNSGLTLIKPTNCVFIGSSNRVGDTTPAEYDAVIVCSPEADENLKSRWKERYIHLACPAGKLGGRLLRKELPKMQETFIKLKTFQRVFFYCSTGTDASVGAALVALCLYFDEDGMLPSHVLKPAMRIKY